MKSPCYASLSAIINKITYHIPTNITIIFDEGEGNSRPERLTVLPDIKHKYCITSNQRRDYLYFVGHHAGNLSAIVGSYPISSRPAQSMAALNMTTATADAIQTHGISAHGCFDAALVRLPASEDTDQPNEATPRAGEQVYSQSQAANQQHQLRRITAMVVDILAILRPVHVGQKPLALRKKEGSKGFLADLSKRERLLVKFLIAILIVGSALGIGLGTSMVLKAV